MIAKKLFPVALLAVVQCAVFVIQAGGSIKSPTEESLIAAVGGACQNTNCAQTDACIPLGTDSAYYDYKQMKSFYAETPNNPFITRDCLETSYWVGTTNCSAGFDGYWLEQSRYICP